MPSGKYVTLIGLLILLTLLLRDVPYFNVIIIGKIWILYLLILLIALMTSLRFRYSMFLPITIILFLLALLFTLISFPFMAEAIGILIYFAFWVIFIHSVFVSVQKDH